MPKTRLATVSYRIDIDEAPRPLIQKSFMKRRDGILGDALQLSLDMDHWNSVNSTEEPILIPMDFTGRHRGKKECYQMI